MAPGGTEALVAMRRELLRGLKKHPALGRHRRRPAAPVPLLVQPRLPAPGAHRLAHPGDRAGEADPVRGGARDPGLARPAPAARRPTGAASRFFHPQLPDEPLIFIEVALTHGMSAQVQPLLDMESPVARAEQRRLRDLLLDHQLPGGPARHLLRQLADQAGGGGPEARIPAPAAPSPRCRRSRASGAGSRRPTRACSCRSGRTRSSGTRCCARSRSRAGIPARSHETLQKLLMRLCAWYLLHAKQRRRAARPGGALPPGQRRRAGAAELARRHLRVGHGALGGHDGRTTSTGSRTSSAITSDISRNTRWSHRGPSKSWLASRRCRRPRREASARGLNPCSPAIDAGRTRPAGWPKT